MMGVPNVTKKLMERVRRLFVLGVVIRVQVQLQSKLHVVTCSNNISSTNEFCYLFA